MVPMVGGGQFKMRGITMKESRAKLGSICAVVSAYFTGFC